MTTVVVKKCLLPVSEVETWWEHLTTISENRKLGAAKAAEIRKTSRKNKQQGVSCIVCKLPYVDYTDQVEHWILFDGYNGWSHLCWL